MTIGTLAPTQASQLQSLAVRQVVDSAAASQASDQTASSVVKVAAGVQISGRTAQSLTDIIQSSQVKLGYSKEETKNFTTMMDAARKYLDDIKQMTADAAAAAANPDPAKRSVSPEVQQTIDAYGKDFIAKMESGLDQVQAAFLNHSLVFKSFSIDATGNVSMMANTFKTSADGQVTTDLSFSFFQSQIEDEKQPGKDPTISYGSMWSVNDQTLFKTSDKGVF